MIAHFEGYLKGKMASKLHCKGNFTQGKQYNLKEIQNILCKLKNKLHKLTLMLDIHLNMLIHIEFQTKILGAKFTDMNCKRIMSCMFSKDSHNQGIENFLKDM
jgi:hypothetical protein